MTENTLIMDVRHIVANDHFGAVLGVIRAHLPAWAMEMPFCGLWRFRNGRIVEHWENAYDAFTLSRFPLEVTVKVAGTTAPASTFELTVAPGFAVGAHVHSHGHEIFYVIEGEIDILAFERSDRSCPDWHMWESSSGRRYLHGGAGAFMFVPERTPHAFANTTKQPAKLFFQSSIPGGHENYFEELAALLRRSDGKPDPSDVRALRRRYDIEQLTALHNR